MEKRVKSGGKEEKIKGGERGTDEEWEKGLRVENMEGLRVG